MKLINLYLFFSVFMGFSSSLEDSIRISNPAPECTVTVGVTPISCTTEGISSNDGSISVVASATSGTTAIQWSSSTSSILVPGAWEQNSLMPGSYTVEVFHNGLSVYKKTHLVEAPDNFEISIEKINNRCYGTSEGSISITATGGTPPYLYSIDNGANYSAMSTFNELPKGSYTIRVKDSSDCIVSQTISISQGPYFAVYHPDALEVDVCLTQEDIDAAFTTWLTGFKYSGGTAPITESITHDPIPSPCGGSITVTYTAVDHCGVEKSCESTFTVPQKNDLEITTQAQPMLVSCEDNPETVFQQWLTSQGSASAMSTCDVIWTNNYSEDLWDNSCENSRNITVTFTASNGCKSVETTATFSIEDTTSPVLSSAPENITVSCNNIPEAAVITALDNCDDTVDVSFEEKTTTEGCSSSIERIWTATDCAGNSTTHSQTITVEDKQAPSFVETLPTDLTAACGETPEAAVITALDNCDDSASVTFEEKTTTDGCSSTIERIWTATDCAGNSTTHLQTITIEDKDAPSFVETLPTDLTAACGQIPEAVVLTALDNCDDTVNVVFEETSTTDGCSSTLERIWTATDCAGNSTTHSQTITIEDKDAPSFVETLPTDLTVGCGEIPEAEILTALDNCDDSTSVTFEEKTTTDGCSSTIQRIWTATDCAGNSTTHSQTITIEGKDAPSFVETLPTDLTVACGQEAPQAVVLTAVDNCDNDVHVTFEEKTTNDGCSSTLERTWTATDCAGNLTTHTQYIKQNQDQQPPSLTASSEGYQQNISVSCGEIPAAPALEFEDDCSDDIHISFSENSSVISQDGSYQITRLWKVSDPCNNAAEFTQVVNITPNNELKFNELPIDLVVECGDSIPDPAILTASNGCETDIPVTFTETQSDTECTQTITRVWTAMDSYGNNILHEQIIIVKDTQAPSFVEALPEDQTLNCSSLPEAAILTAIDDCDENAVVAFEESITTENCTQVIIRLWTASDCAGNFVTHTQTIKLIQDNEAPTLAAASLEAFQDEITTTCANIPDAPDLKFEDQCSTELKINFQETSTYVNDQSDYEIQRVWQVTDPCENQATFTQIVMVSQNDIEQDLVQIMLCQRDAVYDLSTLLPTSGNSGGQWTLSTDDNYLNGSFFDPTTADLGVYTAHYTLDDACNPQTIVTITVHDDCVVLPCDSSQSISISKAITPNGDPYNEYFTVSGLADCGFKLELQVFNRWGAKIYESMDYQNNWNAFSNSGNSQYMPAGTYYYILTVVDSGYDPIKGYVYVGTTSK